MRRIGFIGLGAMGGPMAANLARAGYEVHGFDLSRPLCDKAAEKGIIISGTAAGALAGSEALITMLPIGEQVISVWGELSTDFAKDILLIDCSTIDIESARVVHQIAKASEALSVDAPVSGGVAGAEAGALTFMCGAEELAFRAAKPILEAMGKRIIHCGGPSLGQAAKICNNVMLGVTMIATAEAFVLAEKIGLSHQSLFDVASVSSGQSWSLTSYCPAPGLVSSSPANNDYKPGFLAALMLKDLKLAQETASRLGVAIPLGALATQIYALYNAQGGGGMDFSGVINMIRGDRQS
ncbi:3-hydroxyisobutyrate dehydrogenase [Methylocystis sp. WRRC1]|uniref:3-hydroxyisobutyrate dehydrogenase n=1 Tax=Methylocystis sp. WRRC1 TaxID=1732014 RepID=UPI001D139132|nr:3-hydroxyisobutyrate dehydrogenase [Methylocystis sp. WRRC1]MCC3244825.1 3-hydroxyisobutyrate dehydrogenase [Methylocystis sp. WRRC1]